MCCFVEHFRLTILFDCGQNIYSNSLTKTVMATTRHAIFDFSFVLTGFEKSANIYLFNLQLYS